MTDKLPPKTNLLKLRQKAGFTQLEMSEILGVTETAYASMEATNNRVPPKVNLLELRQRAGFTQLEMSQILGITENTYANWETGRSGMKWIKMVVDLCKLYNCNAINLLDYGTTEVEKNE